MNTVEAVVDSGVEDCGASRCLRGGGEVVPSAMSRATNGSPIPSRGQAIVHFCEGEGRTCGLPFQVGAVDRHLISASQCAAVGCNVTSREDKGDTVHVSSGRRLPLVRRNGAYALEPHVSSTGGMGHRVRVSRRRCLFRCRGGEWQHHSRR